MSTTPATRLCVCVCLKSEVSFSLYLSVCGRTSSQMPLLHSVLLILCSGSLEDESHSKSNSSSSSSMHRHMDSHHTQVNTQGWGLSMCKDVLC